MWHKALTPSSLNYVPLLIIKGTCSYGTEQADAHQHGLNSQSTNININKKKYCCTRKHIFIFTNTNLTKDIKKINSIRLLGLMPLNPIV